MTSPTDAEQSQRSSPDTGSVGDTPEWVRKLLAQQEQAEARHREAEARYEARQREVEARFEELVRQVRGESKAIEPPSAGALTAVAVGMPTVGEPSVSATDPAPATDPTPVADPTPIGASHDGNFSGCRIDNFALEQFWPYGSDSSCAELWIDHAEKLAEKLGMDYQQLCVAFQRRAVGEVKTVLDQHSLKERHDWPSLRRILLSNFGREVRRRWCKQELFLMEGFAGLNLGAALSRLQGLLTTADHSPMDKDPITDLLEAFPKFETVAITMNLEGLTWMEALKVLTDKAAKLKVLNTHQQRPIAKPGTKSPSRGATAAPVATVESAAPVEPAATSQPAASPGPVAVAARPAPRRRSDIKCHRCGRFGHMHFQCKAKVITEDSQSKN